RWQFTGSGLFRRNGNGPDGLDWGNRWQAMAEAGRKFMSEKHNFYASLAYMLEGSNPDLQRNLELPFSGYTIGQLRATAMWRKGRVGISASYLQPVHGALGDGRVKIQSRVQFQFIYYLNNKQKNK